MKRLALAAAAASLTVPALAADLPSPYAPPPPYYVQAPIFTWTGLYVGLNGQFGIGSFTRGGTTFGNPIGGLGGGTIGYNFQQGHLLVGVEGDIAFGSISDSSNFGASSASGAMHGVGTARVRVGYVMGDRALLYVTGGYAGTTLNGAISDFAASPGLMLNESHYLNGFAVGAGVEYAITTRISIKGEYLFTGFQPTTYFAGTRDALDAGAHINLLRLGVNYHF